MPNAGFEDFSIKIRRKFDFVFNRPDVAWAFLLALTLLGTQQDNRPVVSGAVL